MEERIKISKEQISMTFVATFIETTARQSGTDYIEATSKNSTFRINKRVFFETFACVDFVDVAIARKS